MPVSATSRGTENLPQPPGFASVQDPARGREQNLSQAPNTKEYTKIKIIAGAIEKAKVLRNSEHP